MVAATPGAWTPDYDFNDSISLSPSTASSTCSLSLSLSSLPSAPAPPPSPGLVGIMSQRPHPRQQPRMTKAEIKAAFTDNYFKVEGDLEKLHPHGKPVVEAVLEKSARKAKEKVWETHEKEIKGNESNEVGKGGVGVVEVDRGGESRMVERTMK